MRLEIIAEAAQGYLAAPVERTRLLAQAAAKAGADAVKFQLVYADELCTPDYKHYALFSRLEMPEDAWRDLAQLCSELGIRLHLDVFGPRSLALAVSLGVGAIKIHSTDVLNRGLLNAVAKSPLRRVLLSAGGAHHTELRQAYELLSHKDVVVMHGFQGYPTAVDENQLARLGRLRQMFPTARLGFADHTPESDADGLWLSAVAIGAGATVVEKHLTLARVLREEDYESALSPDEFAVYVANMRKAFSALGEATDGPDFGMTAKETAYRRAMKKHVVASQDLAAGSCIGTEALTLKRTSAEAGIIQDIEKVVGRILRRAVKAGQPILEEDLT